MYNIVQNMKNSNLYKIYNVQVKNKIQSVISRTSLVCLKL